MIACRVPVDELEQPQWVSRWKLNLRRRSLLHPSPTAAIATIASETACCQSQLMVATYP